MAGRRSSSHGEPSCHADMLVMCTDAANDAKTAENKAQKVKTRTPEIEPPEGVGRWRRVSAGDVEVYIAWNAPIEALETASQWIAFGEIESADSEALGTDERIAANVEGEIPGDDSSERSSEGGTTSSDSVDSTRVEG